MIPAACDRCGGSRELVYWQNGAGSFWWCARCADAFDALLDAVTGDALLDAALFAADDARVKAQRAGEAYEKPTVQYVGKMGEAAKCGPKAKEDDDGE